MREKYIKFIEIYNIHPPPVITDDNILYYDAIVS